MGAFTTKWLNGKKIRETRKDKTVIDGDIATIDGLTIGGTITIRWFQADGIGRTVRLDDACWQTTLVEDPETGTIRLPRRDAGKKHGSDNPPADVELYEIFSTSA